MEDRSRRLFLMECEKTVVQMGQELGRSRKKVHDL
ncbi:hypothetical protein T01_12559 [Trichinella spiralis]|uniref:Uncharacterized protein n=1 Tax=Trichinella spiralis TaxID=6334 RepID=A0A0V0Z1R2_TRISP|nr:hypothetical protein T01_12559 [Trichinella spiralis]